MTKSESDHRSRYWRSLSELENTPEFEQFVHREFPVAASEFPDGISRRRWLQLMSASLALGGLAGCRYNKEEFAAFSGRVDQRLPGVPQFFATSFELAGRAVNLLVSNVDGRPLKLDGNPQHPIYKAVEPSVCKDGKESAFASAGTDLFTQAFILQLYDPDRLDSVQRGKDKDYQNSDWSAFETAARERLTALKANQGASLAILLPPTRSPSVRGLLAKAKESLPQATFVRYSTVDDSATRAAIKLAAGRSGELFYHLDKANVIAAIDSDLFSEEPGSPIYARQFSFGRDVRNGSMNRLYSIEGNHSLSGAAADTRLAIAPSQIGTFLVELEKRVDTLLGAPPAEAAAVEEEPFDKISSSAKVQRVLDVLASDLVANKGQSVVVVGRKQPAEVQAIGLRLNEKLGNTGKTVELLDVEDEGETLGAVALGDLVSKANAGSIDTLWILGGNPVFGAPADLKLGEVIKKIPNSVYFADYVDETAVLSEWVVPVAHPLEAWSDVRSLDGTYSVGQPQIEPLLNGKATVSILAMLLNEDPDAQKIVRSTAAKIAGSSLNDVQWRKVLHDGYLDGSAAKAVSGSLGGFQGTYAGSSIDVDAIDNGKLDVLVVPCEKLYDGRFANNGWLQELPNSLTKLVWDNAAVVSPETADKLRLSQGDVALIKVNGAEVELPVFLLPGVANGTIVVQLGYGRTVIGRKNEKREPVGRGIGTDVSVLRTSQNPYILTGGEARSTTRAYKLATTQDHFAIDELGQGETSRRSFSLIREGTYDEFKKNDAFAEHLGTHHPALESLWTPPAVNQNHAWAMTVDLNKCIGCNSCVVACQSENNIPIVGKEQVSRGREMHWIRIDRYFQSVDDPKIGGVRDPKVVFQPVACVHCEMAPCEEVCPVAATVHTEEGINSMAYNRCVGTRYCANNCPYKVRRFNYFNFNTQYGYYYGWLDYREQANRKLQQLVLNPEVTVRGRGVMEKCTYCIQRVQNGKIQAKANNTVVQDGDIKTACQVACPTQAIVFGDKNDEKSRVSISQKDPRNYAMLAELNVKPRTLYLARLRNVHHRLKTSYQEAREEEATHGHGHEGHEGEEHGKEESHAMKLPIVSGNS